MERSKEEIQSEILDKAIAHYGMISQMDIFNQEGSELIQAIDKIKRHFTIEQLVAIKHGEYKFKDVDEALLYCNFCSEIADVKVVIAQFEKMFSKEHIDCSYDRKIDRLHDRIQKEKKEKQAGQ